MTSWNAFEHDAFNGFASCGYNARNGGSCIPTTRIYVGTRIYGTSMQPSNLWSASVASNWDSLQRLWSRTGGNTAQVYDGDGKALFTTVAASDTIAEFVGAGQGKAVAVLIDGVSSQQTKLACFSSDGSAIVWTVDESGLYQFVDYRYVSGLVYFTCDDLNAGNAKRIRAYDALTGGFLGMVDGTLTSVCPDAGVTAVQGTDLVRFESDLATETWRIPIATVLNAGPFAGQDCDTDRSGRTYYANSKESPGDYAVVAPDGTRSFITNLYNTGFDFIAVDDCIVPNRIFQCGNAYFADPLDVEKFPNDGFYHSLVSIRTSNSGMDNYNTVSAGDSFSSAPRLNGHWALFT